MAAVDVVRPNTGVPVFEETGFRLSWGAIFAGAVVATALQMVLSILGLAIGLGAYDAGDQVSRFGIGAAIWVLITVLIALFVGGMTTGRLAGILTRGDGILHGIVLWGLTTLTAAWLVASGVGSAVGGAFNIAGKTAGATMNAAATAASGDVDRGDVSQMATKVDSAATALKAKVAGSADSLGQRAEVVAEDAANSASGAAWLTLLTLGLSVAAAAAGAAKTARS